MNKKKTIPLRALFSRLNPRSVLPTALLVAAYIITFIIFDFLSLQFEELKGIVAWYPPAGLTYALLLVFGVRFVPAVTIALFSSSLFIYRMPQPPHLLFLWALIISLLYGLAAAFLRRRNRFDWQLRKLSDVTWLVFTTIVVSGILAVLSVSSSALSSEMPQSEILRAIIIWWIGETVGVLTITPFLLIFVMPGLKRFAEGQPVRLPTHWSFPRPTLTVIAQAFSIALIFLWIFGGRFSSEFRPLYLIALPLIWIAMNHGFKGVTVGIAVLNIGVILEMLFLRIDPVLLGELQLLMIVNCILGLFMGAVVTEQKQAEEALRKSEKELKEAQSLGLLGNWSYDLDNQTITWSDQVYLLYERNPVLGPPTPEEEAAYYSPEQAQILREYSKRAIEEGKNFEYDLEMNLPNGKHTYLSVKMQPVKDAKGRVVKLFGTIQDITERKRIETSLWQRDAILQAISLASARFLRTTDWQDGVQGVLQFLGQGADVSRAYIFENHTNSEGVLLTSQRFGWAAPGIEPQIDNPELQNFPLEEAGFTRWVEVLGQENVIQGHVCQFPESERELLAAQGIQSILIMPIFVGDFWWGYIGFDTCSEEREWDPIIVEALKTAADTFGAAIQNSQTEKRIRRQLERLQTLQDINQAIAGSTNLDITLNVLIDRLIDNFELDAGAILLYRPAMQVLEYVTGKGFQTDAFQDITERIGEGQAGKVALERRTIYIPDLSLETVRFTRAKILRQENFVVYIGVPLLAKGQLVGVLEVFHRSPLDPSKEWLDFLETMARQAAIAIDNSQLFEDLQRSNVDLTLAYDSTIEGWAHALELKDMETEGHSRRVVNMTMDLAKRMGISPEKMVHIRRGAMLHDIGKMGVPDAILQKPGKLTDEEWQIMKQHPVYTLDWLYPIEYLRPALEIPYSHHERWDGTGYPRGIKGELIPLAARIFAVIDVWDALISDRPYRKAWTKDKTLAHIKEQSGKHFDPQVVETFLEIISG